MRLGYIFLCMLAGSIYALIAYRRASPARPGSGAAEQRGPLDRPAPHKLAAAHGGGVIALLPSLLALVRYPAYALHVFHIPAYGLHFLHL